MSSARDRSPVVVAAAWIARHLPPTMHDDATLGVVAALVRAVRRECAEVADAVEARTTRKSDAETARAIREGILALNRAPKREGHRGR